MTREEALHLLGLESAGLELGQARAAYDASRLESLERLASAPTDGLRAKYTAALEQLKEAYAVLSGEAPQPKRNPSSGLSQTQMRDLPGAVASYTEHGDKRHGSLGLSKGDVLAERYEIRRLLGQGGMGAVYEAYDRLKQENIAIKVLIPELLASEKANERLLNEAKTACKLSHPNIVKVFDVGVSGPYSFITMELLEGQSLRERIEAQKLSRLPFPVETVISYGKQLMGALDYANRMLVHRDIKPENIWVMEDGSLKLMDFGIARVLSTTALTRMGISLGTAYYMAPEQLTGAKDVDWRADQFSLGVVLYELLTGQIPQGAVQAPKVLRKDIPASLSSAVMQAMAVKTAQRFGSWKEFASALSRKSVVPVLSSQVLMTGGAIAASLVVVGLLGATGAVSSLYDSLRPVSQQELRTRQAEALGLQAQVEQALKALDDRSKELQQRLRDGRSAVDRLKSQLASAREVGQRTLLQRQLSEAQAEFNLLTGIQADAQKWVFGSVEIANAVAQSKVAEAFIRQQDHVAAANTLKPVAESLDAKGVLLSDIETYRKSVSAMADVRRAWEDYSRKSKLVARHGKEIAPLVAELRSKEQEGAFSELLQSQVIEKLASLYRQELSQGQDQVRGAEGAAAAQREAAAKQRLEADASAKKKQEAEATAERQRQEAEAVSAKQRETEAARQREAENLIWMQCDGATVTTNYYDGDPPESSAEPKHVYLFNKQKNEVFEYDYTSKRLMDNNSTQLIMNGSKTRLTIMNRSSVSANTLSLVQTQNFEPLSDTTITYSIDRASLAYSISESGAWKKNEFHPNGGHISASGTGTCQLIPPQPIAQNRL